MRDKRVLFDQPSEVDTDWVGPCRRTISVRECNSGVLHDAAKLLCNDAVADSGGVDAVEREDPALGPSRRAGAEEPRVRDRTQCLELWWQGILCPPTRAGQRIVPVSASSETV